jgi:hypothetical protein
MVFYIKERRLKIMWETILGVFIALTVISIPLFIAYLCFSYLYKNHLKRPLSPNADMKREIEILKYRVNEIEKMLEKNK